MVNLQVEETSKEEEPFGLGCALDYFSEYEEVLQMIDNLQNLIDVERSVQEKAYEKFSFILSQYIEQPHLLDSHIDSILEKFIRIIRNSESPAKLKHVTFSYMFVVVNVRGYKDIVRHLPHEVADFEPVLQLLEAQDPNDSDTWTTRYILLLWLSIIVMIPFHLSRFDGFDDSDSGKKTVMDRVLNIIKLYAVVPDKCRDAAAFLSYKFITRIQEQLGIINSKLCFFTVHTGDHRDMCIEQVLQDEKLWNCHVAKVAHYLGNHGFRAWTA